ncbi:hypothetical protein JCM3770_006917 [Rhodotorula araucariae]
MGLFSKTQRPTSHPLTPANSQDAALAAPHTSPSSSRPLASAHTSSALPFLPSSGTRFPGPSATAPLALPSSASRKPPAPLVTPPPSPPNERTATADPLAAFLMSSIIDDGAADEDSCPICLELLSLRLAGEKPHVVPVCGHRLHHSCFEAVYGDVQRAKSKTSGSLGLCGVCRRDMKVGDASDLPGKTNKFAKLSGLPSASETTPSFKMRSSTRVALSDAIAGGPASVMEDDALVQLPDPSPTFQVLASAGLRASTHTGTGSAVMGRRGSGDSWAGGGSTINAGFRGPPASGASSSVEIVKPVVTVRAEHASVERSYEHDQKQYLTCMVSVAMPSRYPPPLQLADLESAPLLDSSAVHGRAPPPAPLPLSLRTGSIPSIRSATHSSSPTSSVYSAYAFGSAGSSPSFALVVQDLQARMADWKGHSPEEFGQLKLYDTIHVRKDTATREFTVYLFEEAILCVTDDKRKGRGRLGSAASPTSIDGGDKLRLKGRVYVRHIRSVADTSRDDDLSLTVLMNDDAVAEFVMLFKERTSLEVWKAQIELLLAQNRGASPLTAAFPETPASAAISRDRKDIVSEISSSDQSNLTTFSGYTRTTSTSIGASASVIHEEDEAAMDAFGRFAAFNAPGYTSTDGGLKSSPYAPHGPLAAPLGSLDPPRSLPPLDLMLILSVPPPGTGTLKLDILKNALEFVVAHVGPRTRLSIVTYSAGEGDRASLRKTPFIAVGKPEGRRRLDEVVRELGCDAGALGSMLEHKEERVNVVTACNLALDIVLQRKVKSALTGMILLNDGRDSTQKQQMDLAMARVEAANVPIHTLGWGRSHDPSSLWLLSNHSAGSYTFVKDFYDLRDALAGCIGGILSIAATNVRLHIKVPEQRWFRIRKVSGTPGAIVSKTGTDVDVEIGELRFGEHKDLVIEVELSLAGLGDDPPRKRSESAVAHSRDFGSATDAFFLSQAGINPSQMDEYSASSHLMRDAYDDMPDEVPVFEVNTAYRDPVAGKSVSRLNRSPCLLTLTVNTPSSSSSAARPPAPPVSAPEMVRRRMELLVSDMLSRALLLMTRRNDAQAARLLEETKRIISTISSTLVASSLGGNTGGSSTAHPLPHLLPHARSDHTRRSSIAATATTQRTLLALAEDVDAAHDACLYREQFDTVGRYQAAQQAVVLRDQRAWTPKSATERLVWRADNSLWLVAKSQAWVGASTT